MSIDTVRKDLLDARKSLEGIANANWRDFGDGLNSLEEFELWARSRARYTVNYINEALAALSTIDPDAIRRNNDPPEPGDVVAWRRLGGEWQAETYFDGWPESPEEVILMRAADVKRLTDGVKP